jgi:CTP:molybdopterin cytidylyltransferase MocA
MAEPTFAALVPAAGESSRMTEQKPLIQIGGQTLIERVVSLFQAAGVADVIVVVGHRGDEIIPVLEGTSCTTVTNPDYREGMFSSIRAGVRELRGRCDAFFVLPVDIPLVRPLTISHLMERFGDRSALITHPVGTSGRGHPPLIDSRLIEDLLAFTGTGGLRAFLDGHANRSVEVPVADAWVRRDLDTDGELEAIRRDFESYTIPTPEECGVILDQYLEVPENIKAHSRSVARVASCLGEALNAVGGGLNLNLLTAAGLLHDCFKGVKNHPGRGAAWLEEYGFPQVAAIVAEHIDIQWEEGDQVDERALVYLADRLVDGLKVVKLAQRQAGALEKYGHEETVCRNIAARFNKAEKIQAAVERITGLPLTGILGPSGKCKDKI